MSINYTYTKDKEGVIIHRPCFYLTSQGIDSEGLTWTAIVLKEIYDIEKTRPLTTGEQEWKEDTRWWRNTYKRHLLEAQKDWKNCCWGQYTCAMESGISIKKLSPSANTGEKGKIWQKKNQ